ncbi:MAG: CoA-disulfide reductase [Omnitrophica bacterium RIFCSPLOWO2_02_FULL_44_11]|nr:MAG: CoA-disulfide reductase [Omnitrophica bacterium RIFCSPLOWO2_02_FULL_44_11]
MRILIVGGVAGGASCAARVRRLSEDAEIVIFERGPYVSFANCGLPYYVGGEIPEEGKLLVASPALFKKRMNIEVRLKQEVVRIDRAKSEIEVKDLETGNSLHERYDALVLSPGAIPIRSPLPGIDLAGIFTLRTIPDAREIKLWIQQRKAKRAVIVGGGFIGLEMAENLTALGLKVSIIEMQNQVLPPFDPEMVSGIQGHLKEKGVDVYLKEAVAGFEEKSSGGAIRVLTKSGVKMETDLVLLSIGLRPDVKLAQEAGLMFGKRGGIEVDQQMRTSDLKIWAVGDAVEVEDIVTKEKTLLALAGPANRQGRIAADAILGRASKFRGVQGTAICKVFDLTAACTGANEKTLMRLSKPYEKVYLHPFQHASYYPGASQMNFKIIFDPADGTILGAQCIGAEGVDKRMDVIAMAIQKHATIFDLEEAEFCYSPQFGAAKDPVNFSGMIAANAIRGDCPVAHWENVKPAETVMIDVRTPEEYLKRHVPGAKNIPVDELRKRLSEIPKDKEILVYCGVGLRGYYAARILLQNGFTAKNLSGGIKTYLNRQ